MLVLASASPRRAMLLRENGYMFEKVEVSVSEKLPQGIAPEAGVRELAMRKAQAGASKWLAQGGDPLDVILGADTLVVLDGQVLGKPEDASAAERMLRDLSGKTHAVLTGIALLASAGGFISDVVETEVRFRQISIEDIRAYVAGGEPMDKAGAYGIQGEAGKFVEGYTGSLSNIIGLPMECLAEHFEAWGIEQTNSAPRGV